MSILNKTKMMKNISPYQKFRKYGNKALIFSVLVILSISFIQSVQARNENIPGNSYSGKVSGGEGKVTFEFAHNNQYSIQSNVDVELNLNMNAHLSNIQLSFNISASAPVSIIIETEEFGGQFSRNRFRNQGETYKNQWGAYIRIRLNTTVEYIDISSIIGDSEEVNEEDQWVINTADEEWEILETEVVNDELYTTLSTESTDVYLSIFTPSFDYLIIAIIAAIAIPIISLSIVFSKTEYREYIRNRIFSTPNSVHRLSIEEVLENENRSKIIDLILDNPGIHFNQMLRETGLSPGNLVWHLDILDTYKIIGKKNIGQYLVYFPYYNTNPMSVIDIKLAKSKVTLEILNIIELNPGTFGSAIAKQLHLDHKTIKYHVDKLIEGDLITTKKQGRKNLLYPKWGTLHELKIDKDRILNGDPEHVD